MSANPYLTNTVRAVVINVDTGPVTALAVLSLQRYYQFPITLVDCSRKLDQQQYARELAQHLQLELVLQPLRPHGETLDQLLLKTDAEHVLLLDSDAELLGEEMLEQMIACTSDRQSFGSGFVQQTMDMSSHSMPFNWYCSRMWIPCCMLHTSPVKEALNRGVSFAGKKIYNDLPNWPRLSRILSYRQRLPGGNRLRLTMLDRFRNNYFGVKPTAVVYDTGAIIFNDLLARGYTFQQLDWRLQQQCVAHYHGVTRHGLNWFDHQATSQRYAFEHAMQRIREHYPGSLPASLLR